MVLLRSSDKEIIRFRDRQALVWVIESFINQNKWFSRFPIRKVGQTLRSWVLDLAWYGEQLTGRSGDRARLLCIHASQRTLQKNNGNRISVTCD
jgi:hypothetical protein